MSSFVTEVLASSGKLEKDDLACKISKLSRKVEATKEEVTDMINKKYTEFMSSMEAADELVDQVESVSKDIDLLKSCIENEVKQNLHDAVTEYGKLKQQLEKNTTVIGMLQHLQEFDTAMEEYHKALQEKNYVVAAKQHGTAQANVDALKAWKDTELPLSQALSSEITIQRENLIYHLGEEWKKLAVWKLPSTKELTSMKSFLTTALHLNTGACKADGSVPDPLLSSILQALSVQGELHKKIKLFGQVLFKYMLKPLILYPSLVVEVNSQPEQGIVLSLHCEETKAEHPNPSQVYTKVLTVLTTLHKQLFDVPVGEKKVSEILGDLIWEEMSDCLICDCLVHSIPTNSSQLAEYSAVIKQTEEFESSLKQMGYLTGDSTDLLKYARNVNCHFASKKCQDVIVSARKLMTSDMHNTVKITPEYKLSIPKLPNPAGGEKEKKELIKKSGYRNQQTLENEKQLSRHTLCLPVCRISESVQQLMDLAIHTLSEAVGSSPQCAVQLFYTVRNIFHLFYDVVPTYHKENFLKLPHLAAIEHNNCMFIAHHLLTLGHQFKPHLPLKDGVAYFVDMVPGFRRLGARCFVAQMNVQKAEMLERLSTARNFSNLDDEDNYSVASKAIRQVIHQLRRLGKVWQDVLPVNIYCKAMGTLLNTAICELINKIMMLEDISNEDGDRLRTLCQTIIEEGPLVFTPLPDENKNKKYQEEVPVYVKKWMTLKELSIVLNASLQEIVDRWAEGKGPLAVEFSCNEMKSLIRALFKNTERRAAALTKIVK
ncbi:centromere/kinetochore protein zw10 homolog [Triplophysa rosa]|uniref:Centromere/kinetochore protein zw10 homolog n=1 Tax=Triplophysa rosa TaxID=992332 RepID=A0A9W7TER3_TRIRA|nr:centromere/kinetochore protein zw10 homolog [Triplophysa rosa]KAI7795860.1 centromere/kinetochore protein zw10-like protein [Triplophysa rosa]